MTTLKETFGNMMTGEARLTVKTLENGQFAVVAYLPAGIDLYPMVYGRFDTLDAAQECFNKKRAVVARYVGATA